MDWLRIGAFGLLILYHIGMVFAPWQWVIKADTTHPWLIPPMAFLTPWRLPLLFGVSGFASRALLDRSDSLGSFVASRNRRLLVPLAFGMVAIVPIEMWVRVREGGYAGSLLAFWVQDYWRAGSFHGVTFPSWEHLWFVAYLWAYTIVLAGIVGAGGRAGAVTAWLAEGRRLLWAPIAALVTARLALLFVVPESHSLLRDWAGHVEYGTLFAFGFVLAGRAALWRPVARVAAPAIATALFAGAIVVAVEWTHPGETVPSHAVMALDRAAQVTMAWSMTLALFHAATRWLDRDHRWRAPLARAVFPAYILHHTTIVVAAWYVLPLALAPATGAALLTGAVIVVCVAGYLLGRRFGRVGTLIGLPPRERISMSRTPPIG